MKNEVIAMICRHCGKEHSAEGAFCPYCGMRNEEEVREKFTAAADTQAPEAVLDPSLEEEEKQKNRLLCILSLIFGFGVTSAISVTSLVLRTVFPEVQAVYKVADVISEISFLFPIAGLVLMIVARVRDPKSRFGKVVMWLYIISAIVAVVVTIILIFAFVYAMVSCCESFQNCN